MMLPEPVFRYTRVSEPIGSAISTFIFKEVVGPSAFVSLLMCSGRIPKHNLLVDILGRNGFDAATQGQRQRVGIRTLDNEQTAIALLNLAFEQIHRRDCR